MSELDEQPPCRERGCHLALDHKGSHAAIGSFLGFTRWKVWCNDAPDAYSPRPWAGHDFNGVCPKCGYSIEDAKAREA